MVDRQHPYRRCVQYTIEILHVPLRYPIRKLENDVMQRWGRCIDNCRIIGNDADIRGTHIFYINFSNEYEQQASDCADFLKDQGYLTDGMWLKEKVREIQPRGRGRGRGRERGQRTSHEQPNPGYNLPSNIPIPGYNLPSDIPFPGYNLPSNIPFPGYNLPSDIPFPGYNLPSGITEIPKKELTVHVKNIPSFVDEDIFKDMILDADYKFKIREDLSNDSLKEALVYVPDEVIMKELISKLSHLKVGGNILDAKEKGIAKPEQKNVYPSDHMQHPRPDARQPGLHPQQGNNKQHARAEDPEPRMQKTIQMSNLLYEFVRVKMKTQIDGFCKDRGAIRHENGVLFLESCNTINITTIHTSLTAEVCERIEVLGREDYAFLTTNDHQRHSNIVQDKCSAFKSAGQLQYNLNSLEYSLHLYGISDCVRVVLKDIEDALYYQFYLTSPMDIYISVFPGVIQEIVGTSGDLRGTSVTIRSHVGIDECKRIREKIREVQDAILCETCMSFSCELVTSGLKFCKQNNFRVAIIFKDSNGLLYKKYKPDTVVTLCGRKTQITEVKGTFSNPISSKMPATRKGIDSVTQKSRGTSLIKQLEFEFSVYIQLLPNSVEVVGFLKEDVTRASARIQNILDNVDVFLSQFIEKYQVFFFQEGKTYDVQWTMDMLSEFELNYDVELIAFRQDYKLKGSQESFQKIENDRTQISASFRDIIIYKCAPVLFNELSVQFINNLMNKFFENHFQKESTFLSYGWNIERPNPRDPTLHMVIELIGKSSDVNLMSSKLKSLKPLTGQLRERFGPNELQQLKGLDSTFRSIIATEFVSFIPFSNQISYHSLGISSQKPWEIFNSIMSDQEVVRTVPVSPTLMHFLRVKKLLKDCENESHCTIAEETRDLPREGERNRRRQPQPERNVLTVKGKHTDVKAATELLKKWNDNFTYKSSSKVIPVKLKNFFSGELESMKKEIENDEMLLIDIRDAKKKLYTKTMDNEEEIEISIRIQTLDKPSCDKFTDIVDEKLKFVRSEEFQLSERQLTLLMSACKDQAIPKNQHFYVEIEHKARRTGTARIVAIQHFKDALSKGLETTAPYLQFLDQVYSPPIFLKELLFHYRKYTESINVNARTLGIECTRPSSHKDSYNLSGNSTAIETMKHNLRSFEMNFVRQCIQSEFEVNLPIKDLKNDSGFTNLERDLTKNCIVKIFMSGELPYDVEREMKLANLQEDWGTEVQSLENVLLRTYSYGNTTIEVMKGDITTLQVACIVNAANEKLQHDGGVAKAISDAGGPTIQKGCTKYIQEHGPISVGSAVLQGAGNLSCKKLIHVSSALWDPMTRETCIEQLKNCVVTVFRLCDTHKLPSIAFPGISTGNYGFPALVSTSAIVQECKSYLDTNPQSSIQRLIFIDVNENIARNYNTECQRQFPRLSKQPFEEELAAPLYPPISLPPKPTNYILPNTTVSNEYEFLWKENDNKFYPYDPKYQNILKSAYKTNPLGTVTFTRGEYSYLVGFSSLTQTNISTNVQRTIQIKAIPDANSIPLPFPRTMSSGIDGEESDLHCYWYYFDEANQWKPFAPELTKQLSDSYLNNPKGSLTISQGSYDYNIDFHNMSQTNLKTNTVRVIKVDKNKFEVAMSKLSITSGENVMLFGIKENMELARNKFTHFIKSKCQTKHVDIRGVPKTVMIPTIVRLKALHPLVKVEIKDKAEDYVIKLDGFGKHVNFLYNGLIDVYIKCLEENKQDQGTQIVIPKNWEKHLADEMIRVVTVVNGSLEWTQVSAEFNRTSRRIIQSIDRVQNKWLWRKYQQTKDSFKEIGQNDNEMTVFHGTRTTDPDLIIKGPEGFDFRHSSEGMWGRANYFALNASFSESYQYTQPQTNLKMILQVKLMAGNVVHLPPTGSLTMPPLLPNTIKQSFIGQRYDTVSGDHSGGSKVYMVYTNERAYPEYLITYS